MRTIEEEIVLWLNQRPDWIKMLADWILLVGDFDSDAADSLAADLIEKKTRERPESFTVKDLPTSKSTGPSVALTGISGLSNINALAEDGELTFSDSGITVIYGDNGSGKSGFARLVKEVVGARHRQEILPNAFGYSDQQEQKATISYRVNDEERTFVWPQKTDVALQQIHFYDEACGDHYLTNDSELSYRPSALKLMDQLIAATDLLREAIASKLQKLDSSEYHVSGLLPTTPAGIFAEALNASTTNEQIDVATELPAESDKEFARLVEEEGRLQATNPGKEKARLEKLAEGYLHFSEHVQTLSTTLSPESAAKLETASNNARRLRAAADLASKDGFANDPLDGVGSATWRILWEAAEKYSQQEAYHELEFPHTGGEARCPFCQQLLDSDASDRLARFNAFVHDETAKNAQDAEDYLRLAVNAVDKIEVSTVATTGALALIEAEDSAFADELRTALEIADTAKTRIGQRIRNETNEHPIELQVVDTKALAEKAQLARQRAEKIDAAAFATQLKAATDAKNILRDRIELAKHTDNLKKEAARLRAVRDITALRNSISTQPITKLSTTLTRTYVNDHVNDQFSRESDHLGLNHVKLDDRGGGKGKLRHKPGLLGATLKTKTVQDVLSEGEQTALGLAGILTEINFDSSESALVLDDPITSLDHGRREKVAKRIAELAARRQVIVFTHDLTFLGDIIRAAHEEGVTLLERSIVKSRLGVPGNVLATHPWKAKDAKSRIGDLRADLARLKKEELTLSPEEYENRVQLWAGKLSETWERLVRNDVVGKVVDRGTTEVRPKMIRLLARITPADNTDFQSGYSNVSKWAPRHDKSEEVNFEAPAAIDMEIELERIDAWRKRIQTYAQD